MPRPVGSGGGVGPVRPAKRAKPSERRVHPRQAFEAQVEAVTAEGRHPATAQDISFGGIGIGIAVTLQNDQFVELHIDNVGPVPGHVVRTYQGGVGVAFDVDDEERRRIAEAIEKARRAGDLVPTFPEA